MQAAHSTHPESGMDFPIDLERQIIVSVLPQVVKSALPYAKFLSLPLCQLKDSLTKILRIASLQAWTWFDEIHLLEFPQQITSQLLRLVQYDCVPLAGLTLVFHTSIEHVFEKLQKPSLHLNLNMISIIVS
jgi:hypothetical protein